MAKAATEQTARRYRRFADQPTRAVGISFADRACSHGHLLTANNTNPTQLKAGNGALCGSLVIANPTSVTAGDLRFYDTASVTTATCSSAASVVWNVPAPTNSTAANVAGWSIPIPTDLVSTTASHSASPERRPITTPQRPPPEWPSATLGNLCKAIGQ